MTLTPDERKALLGLLSLLLLGQGAAFLRDEHRARPDRELSAWLTQAQAARAESLRRASTRGSAGPGSLRARLPGPPADSASIHRSGGAPELGLSAMGTGLRGLASGLRAQQTGFETVEPDSPMGETDFSAPEPDPPGSVPVEPPAAIPAGVASTGRVAINRASARDLEALPGVGPALAKRMVEERERSGPYRSSRDLLRVKGIGPKKQALIQDRVDWSL